jgi:hypothetical protein
VASSRRKPHSCALRSLACRGRAELRPSLSSAARPDHDSRGDNSGRHCRAGRSSGKERFREGTVSRSDDRPSAAAGAPASPTRAKRSYCRPGSPCPRDSARKLRLLSQAAHYARASDAGCAEATATALPCITLRAPLVTLIEVWRRVPSPRRAAERIEEDVARTIPSGAASCSRPLSKGTQSPISALPAPPRTTRTTRTESVS